MRRKRLVKLPFIDCIHSFSVFPNVYTCPRRWWMRLPWRQPQNTQKVVRLIQTDAHTKMTLFKHAAILLICINVWVWTFEFSADSEIEGQFHSFLQIFCWFSEKRSLEEFLQISVVSVQLKWKTAMPTACRCLRLALRATPGAIFFFFFLFENNFIEKKLKLATRPLEGNQGQCCDRCTSESFFFFLIRIKSVKIYFGIEFN